MLESIGFGETKTISATCACCGKTEEYRMDERETAVLILYHVLGREMGRLQELFPNIPSWIRSGALDRCADGFCICPDCCS